MLKLSYHGNQALLDLPKTAFLASRRILPQQVLKCYDWAAAQRAAGVCVMSGFHSPLEKDVLRFLLKGKQPVIVVLARRLYKRLPEEWQAPLDQQRLLIVSTSSAEQAKESTTMQRNRYLIGQAQRVVIGSLAPGRSLARLLAEFPNREFVFL